MPFFCLHRHVDVDVTAPERHAPGCHVAKAAKAQRVVGKNLEHIRERVRHPDTQIVGRYSRQRVAHWSEWLAGQLMRFLGHQVVIRCDGDGRVCCTSRSTACFIKGSMSHQRCMTRVAMDLPWTCSRVANSKLLQVALQSELLRFMQVAIARASRCDSVAPQHATVICLHTGSMTRLLRSAEDVLPHHACSRFLQNLAIAALRVP